MASTTTAAAATAALRRVTLSPRVRRAFLYLQGFDGKKVAKAAAHPTLDCVCLDMEDGVGIHMKDAAREGIQHALQNVNFGRTERVVRINAFDSSSSSANDLALRDLDSVIQGKVLPDAICIPKVESAKDVWTVSERLDALGDVAANVRIIIMIESAPAVLNMKDICSASPLHRLDGVIFGADDYASTVGATRSKEGSEMNFARNWVLLQAKAAATAANMDVIDMVQIDFHDVQQLAKESRESFLLGFTGKQVIHPKQIEPVQEAYSPTAEAIAHAAAVVQANIDHQKHGEGAFSFQGKMIDMPTVKQFEYLLQRAQLMGLYEPPT